MRRRGILSTPLQLVEKTHPQTSKFAYFNFLKDIQSDIRFQILQNHDQVSSMNSFEKLNLQSLRDLYYSAREEYLLPVAKTKIPTFLLNETDHTNFSFRELDGFSRRFELLPQRIQLEYSLLAYITRKQCFLDGMPKDKVELDTQIYYVQKLERLLMQRYDERATQIQKEGGKIADIQLEVLLDELIKEETIKKLKNNPEKKISINDTNFEHISAFSNFKNETNLSRHNHDVVNDLNLINGTRIEKSKNDFYQFFQNESEIDELLLELFKYITISHYNTDFFSKHHQRWRLDAFRRIEEMINEEKEFL